jgi:hypothetical protein
VSVATVPRSRLHARDPSSVDPQVGHLDAGPHVGPRLGRLVGERRRVGVGVGPPRLVEHHRTGVVRQVERPREPPVEFAGVVSAHRKAPLAEAVGLLAEAGVGPELNERLFVEGELARPVVVVEEVD